jgi:hypothetical protein
MRSIRIFVLFTHPMVVALELDDYALPSNCEASVAADGGEHRFS